MTTSSSTILPTDLSLKRVNLCSDNGQEITKSSISSFTQQFFEESRRSDNEELPERWKAQLSPQNRPMSSPTLSNINNYSESTLLDNQTAATLLLLDNLLSNNNNRSSSLSVFNRSFHQCNSSDNDDIDTDEKSPADKSLRALAKSLAEAQRESYALNNHQQNRIKKGNSFVMNANSTRTKHSCKRKGGWKFHDLSDEGDGFKRKRPYGQNKLENEILMIYQDRVAIKEVPVGSYVKSGEKLVVVEPSFISDPDLVKHNAALRIVLDKKNGIYLFQVLPFTIEQGFLADKNKVLCVVAKMLGENGAVLCPGIAKARPSSYITADSSFKRNLSQETSNSGISATGTNNKYIVERETNEKQHTSKLTVRNNSDATSKTGQANKFKTDKLIISLNAQLSQSNRPVQQDHANDLHNETRCLLWHVPTLSAKGKRAAWPEYTKWCINCLKRFSQADAQTMND